MTRALVIGAGVIGAATAHRLAEAGADVTVLDAAGRTPGTSSATFSIDVTHLKTPHSYFLLNQRSAALHRELEREIQARTGAPGWRHPAPLVQWGHTEEEQRTLRARAERLADWGHPCRTADPGELRTLAPAVDPASCRATELVVHDDATWYDAPLLAHTLLDRAAALGADIRYDTPVTALLRDGIRVRGAEARGRHFEADHVVNCAGPDAGRIAELAGVRLPLRRIPGLVGESVPLAEPLRAIVATPGVDLRPAPGNRVCAISWPVDALLAPTPDTQVPPEADLLGRCAAVLPAFRAPGRHPDRRPPRSRRRPSPGRPAPRRARPLHHRHPQRCHPRPAPRGPGRRGTPPPPPPPPWRPTAPTATPHSPSATKAWP